MRDDEARDSGTSGGSPAREPGVDRLGRQQGGSPASPGSGQTVRFGGHGKILAVIALAIVGLTIPFGFAIHRNHAVFSAYRIATLENPDQPPRWQVEEVAVEECVTDAIGWALECPGVQSWCEAQVPVVMSSCLKSIARDAECAAIGDAHMTTHFGYDQCLERREGVEGTYRARAHKKYCALAYRAVAGHCRRLSES